MRSYSVVFQKYLARTLAQPTTHHQSRGASWRARRCRRRRRRRRRRRLRRRRRRRCNHRRRRRARPPSAAALPCRVPGASGSSAVARVKFVGESPSTFESTHRSHPGGPDGNQTCSRYLRERLASSRGANPSAGTAAGAAVVGPAGGARAGPPGAGRRARRERAVLRVLRRALPPRRGHRPRMLRPGRAPAGQSCILASTQQCCRSSDM